MSGLPFHDAFRPTSAQTLMLRACLRDADSGRTAWEAWERDHGGPRAVLGGARDGVKRLLPLLADAQARLQLDLDPLVTTCLRTAHAREAFRWKTFSGIIGPALDALRAAGVPFVVLKGAALAEHVYAEPALRHCHDCDLLVPADAHLAAENALASLSFRRFVVEKIPRRHRTVLVHETGLPIQLHEQLFDLPSYLAPVDAMAARAEERVVCDVPVKVLRPDDMLLHICVQAACAGIRRTQVWACDAAALIAHHSDLDFDAVAETALTCRAALPAAVMMQVLKDDIGLPIPDRTLETLNAAARRASRSDLEALLFCASAEPRGSLGRLIREASTTRRRSALVKWMFAPSPLHMRWAYGIEHSLTLPLWYAWRPLHAVLRRLRLAHVAGRRTELPAFMDQLSAPASQSSGRRAA